MGNNYDVFKTISLDELLVEFNGVIDKLYKEYSFLNMDKNIFSDILKLSIRDSFDNYNDSEDVDYCTYFYDIMVNTIKSYMLSIQDSDDFITVLNNYISKNCKSVDDSNKAINQLKKTSLFFSDNDLIISPDIIGELLNNPIINSYLTLIFKDNADIIKNGEYIETFDDYLIISLIELYASKNNIEIKSIYELDADTTSDNSDYYNEDIEKQYSHDINNIDILSPEEERILGYKMLNGDQFAKDKLIEHSLRLVKAIAARFIGRGISYMDLIQEGNIGLIQAANKYDVRKGYRFSTFATWWIRQAMTRAIYDGSRNIRLPVYVMHCIGIFNRITVQLASVYGREPTDKEIADFTGMQEETVDYLKKISNGTVSLNSKITDDEDTELCDVIQDDRYSLDEEVIHNHLREDLLYAINNSKLTDREKDIILSRFGLNPYEKEKTQEELGKKYGITRERVRQIENEVLKKLYKSNKNLLIGYMDDDLKVKKPISCDESKRVYFNKINTQGYTTEMKLLEEFTIERTASNMVLNKKSDSNKDVKKVVNSKVRVPRTKSNKDEIKQINKVKASKKAFKRLTNIYTYFDVPKDILDEAIDSLDSYDKEILYKKFGGNLENPVITQLPKEENHRLYSGILKLLERKIEKLKRLNR